MFPNDIDKLVIDARLIRMRATTAASQVATREDRGREIAQKLAAAAELCRQVEMTLAQVREYYD